MELNPVFINELRQSILRRKPIQALAVWAAITIVLMWLTQFGRGNSTSFTVLPVFLMPLFAPTFAAGVFAKEYEQRTWQDLTLTRLTNFQVVTGKFFASVLIVWFMAISFIPAVILMLIWQGQFWAEVPGWWTVKMVFNLLVSAALYVLIVMVCSRYTANRRTALVVSYLALLFYGLFNAMVWNLVGEDVARSDQATYYAAYNTPYGYGNGASVQPPQDPLGPGFMQGIHLIFCTVVGGGAAFLLWVSLSEQRGYRSGPGGSESARAWQPAERKKALGAGR